MRYLYLSLPLGSRAENVHLRRSTRVLWPPRVDILEADCRGRDLGCLFVTSGTNGLEGNLYLLTDCGDYLSSTAIYVEQQRSLLAVRGDATVLAACTSTKHPEHAQSS